MKRTTMQARMKRLFTQGFTALDIAEPLYSFDGEKDAADVKSFMTRRELDVVGVRVDGVVAGFVKHEELNSGRCIDQMHVLDAGEVLSKSASLSEVIDVLADRDYLFVSSLGAVGAIVTRSDIEKPPARMWLFGMITIIEMFLAKTVETRYRDGSWQTALSEGRLRKAIALQNERRRRHVTSSLVSCLQLSDKAHVIMKDPAMRDEFGFESKSAGERAIKELESLRNNLAHASDIVADNWSGVVTLARRLERIITRI